MLLRPVAPNTGASFAMAAHAAPCRRNPARSAASSSSVKGRRLGCAGEGSGKRGVPSGCVERLGLGALKGVEAPAGVLVPAVEAEADVEDEAGKGAGKEEGEEEGEAARAREGGRCGRGTDGEGGMEGRKESLAQTAGPPSASARTQSRCIPPTPSRLPFPFPPSPFPPCARDRALGATHRTSYTNEGGHLGPNARFSATRMKTRKKREKKEKKKKQQATDSKGERRTGARAQAQACVSRIDTQVAPRATATRPVCALGEGTRSKPDRKAARSERRREKGAGATPAVGSETGEKEKEKDESLRCRVFEEETEGREGKGRTILQPVNEHLRLLGRPLAADLLLLRVPLGLGVLLPLVLGRRGRGASVDAAHLALARVGDARVVAEVPRGDEARGGRQREGDAPRFLGLRFGLRLPLRWAGGWAGCEGDVVPEPEAWGRLSGALKENVAAVGSDGPACAFAIRAAEISYFGQAREGGADYPRLDRVGGDSIWGQGWDTDTDSHGDSDRDSTQAAGRITAGWARVGAFGEAAELPDWVYWRRPGRARYMRGWVVCGGWPRGDGEEEEEVAVGETGHNRKDSHWMPREINEFNLL
ncbi:hypothetical protein DFH09DRAFT_1271240 [Mycena vulgaris]|nr:hypothetical protein DFH09DRAFT_1271240 [Mycena vulgaris]